VAASDVVVENFAAKTMERFEHRRRFWLGAS
jgi:hypothetical protein